MIGTNNADGIQYASGAVLNPRTPFEDKIKKLRFGDLIVITGRTAPKGKRFDINLCNVLDNGKTEYVLHLNPRFSENRIIRNSTINEKWGPEERFGGLGNLDTDSDFECVILIHTDCYKIAFNGKHHCDYRHRLPYTSVNKLLIAGEVVISSIYVQPGPVGQLKHRDGSQPLAMPAYPGSPQKSVKAVSVDVGGEELLGGYNLTFAEAYEASQAQNGPNQGCYNNPDEVIIGCHPAHIATTNVAQAVPYLATFDGMKHNQAIYVSGVPIITADSFAINLRVGSEKSEDIAFHVRPHFDTQYTAVNNFSNGEWGRQRDITVFPFKRGMHFDLIIKCDVDAFQVSINNNHYLQFQHQIPDVSKLSSLEVEGDINLVHVRMR